MFKITPIQNAKRQQEVATMCSTYAVDGAFAYEMIDVDSGALLGMSQFEIVSGKGILYDLRPAPSVNDFEAMFILGRQTLNFIDLCGAHACDAKSEAAEERLLKCVGFQKENDSSFHCEMSGMFDGHCDGKQKELQ